MGILFMWNATFTCNQLNAPAAIETAFAIRQSVDCEFQLHSKEECGFHRKECCIPKKKNFLEKKKNLGSHTGVPSEHSPPA